MAQQAGTNLHYGYTSPPKSPPRANHPSSTLRELRTIDRDSVVPGRIFWLPQKGDLPDKAVRRAHGKGAVEEGIYNHPVVVISRPADEPHVAHFHLITSFQGKKLHEIYGKSNEFHAGRRSWYLPISPSPDHPDANSKKSKKRFPTLELAGGAVLRWDSYVNIRHVYKIDWSYLRPYANPDTPYMLEYRFESQPMIQMLAKGKVLTTYESGPQVQKNAQIPLSPNSDAGSFVSISTHSERSVPTQWDFSGPNPNSNGIMERPPRAPPDRNRSVAGLAKVAVVFHFLFGWPWEVVKRLWAWLRWMLKM